MLLKLLSITALKLFSSKDGGPLFRAKPCVEPVWCFPVSQILHMPPVHVAVDAQLQVKEHH